MNKGGKMKKFVIVFLCVGVFALTAVPIQISAYDFDDEYATAEYNAMDNLKEFDIIRDPNKWWPDEYITRRDALKMVFVSKNAPYETPRTFFYDIEDIPDLKEQYEDKDAGLDFDFIDLEPGSQDELFAMSLVDLRLFTGKKTEKGTIADLDSYMTYEEAVVTMLRLLPEPGSFHPYDTTKPLYDVAMQRGLPSYIKPEQMGENIRAYRYMLLLYDTLYVYTFRGGIGNIRYIDWCRNPVNFATEWEKEDFHE